MNTSFRLTVLLASLLLLTAALTGNVEAGSEPLELADTRIPAANRTMANEWGTQGGRLLVREHRFEVARMTEDEYIENFNEEMARVNEQIERGEWDSDDLERWQYWADNHGMGELFRKHRRDGTLASLPFYGRMVEERRNTVAELFEDSGHRTADLRPLREQKLVEYQVLNKDMWREDIELEVTSAERAYSRSTRISDGERVIRWFPEGETVFIDPLPSMRRWESFKNPFAFPLEIDRYEGLTTIECDTGERDGVETIRVVKAAGSDKSGRHGVDVFYFDPETLRLLREVRFIPGDWWMSIDCSYQTLPGGRPFLETWRTATGTPAELPDGMSRQIADGALEPYAEEVLSAALGPPSSTLEREVLEADLDVPVPPEAFDFRLTRAQHVVDRIRNVKYDVQPSAKAPPPDSEAVEAIGAQPALQGREAGSAAPEEEPTRSPAQTTPPTQETADDPRATRSAGWLLAGAACVGAVLLLAGLLYAVRRKRLRE